MTTLNLQVGASTDDAIEATSDGSMNLTLTQVWFGKYDYEAHGGCRWTGTSALAGATINSAQMQFKAIEDDSGAFDGDWYGHDAASPGTFTATAYNISDTAQRPRTTATFEGDSEHLNDLDGGNWTAGNWAVVTSDDVGGSLVDVIQELADSYTPSAVVMLHIYEDGSQERRWYTYDQSSVNAPKLDIDYTAAGAEIASQRLKIGVGR